MKPAHVRPGRHRLLVVTTGLLTLAGLACIAFALANQQHAAEPSPATAASSASSPAGTLPGGLPTAPPTMAASVVGRVLPSSAPVTIEIPAIGLDSSLEIFGQNPDGSI